MKLIKPKDLPFTSNIPEPDANQGEAVYVAAQDTVYPFSKAGQIDSVSYDSANSRYSAMLSSDSIKRVRESYTSSNAIISSSVIPRGAIVEVSAIEGRCRDAAFLGGVMLIILEEYGLYRSDDGGESWSLVDVDVGESRPPTAVNTAFGEFYCTVLRKVFKSSDGISWVLDNNSTQAYFPKYSSLVFDGIDLSVIGARFTKRRAGGAWIVTENNMPFYESINIATGGGGAIYIMTRSSKSYLSQDGGVNWSLASSYIGNASSIVNDGLDFYFTVRSSSVLSARYYVSPGVYYSNEIDLNIPSSDRVQDMKISDGKIIIVTHLGRIIVRDLSEGKNYNIENNGQSLNAIGIADSYINIFSNDSKVYTLGLGSLKIASEYNRNDNSMSGGLTVNNYVKSGKQYAQVVNYNTLFTSVTDSNEYELKSSEFDSVKYGQCCYDGKYVFQLIYDFDSWFVYRIDTSTGLVNSFDFGVDNSDYINQFNSDNPSLFLLDENLNVPANNLLPNGQFDTVLRLDKTPSTTVEVEPNKILTSNAVAAIYTSGETVTWFCENNTVEITDDVNFDSLGGYREGDEVISLSTHRRYRAAAATLETPELGVNQVPPTWVDISPTNRYAPFSIYVHELAIASNEENTITYTFELSDSDDSVGFFGLSGVTDVDVIARDANGDDVYVDELSLIDLDLTELEGELTYLNQLIVTSKLGGSSSLKVVLQGDPSGEPAKVGRILPGRAVDLGVAQYGSSLSIQDFSRKERDEFGNFDILKRDTAKNINFDVKIDKSKVNAVFTFLSGLTTTPCVFLGDDDDAALQVYGFYSDYTHNVDYPSITTATISVEGLT